MPVGLHAGAEHGAEQPHLRDAPRDPGLSRRALGRPAGADVCRAASLRTRARDLSRRGARLDSPPRRAELAPAAAARARTRRDLSLLSMRDHCSAGQHTIPGISNLSTHIPKPLAKKVLANAMSTRPPSDSALNLRSASARSSIDNETEKPCGLW